jgi:hypothetical protein
VYGVNAPGVEQDSLRESSFAGIYVGADADISQHSGFSCGVV